MMEFKIEQLFPRFLLRDKNGYAIAKAMEAGLRAMDAVMDTGLATLSNVEDMPIWRLDEMAWELGCMYDHNGDLTAKRRWIQAALLYDRVLGTPQAILNYLEGLFLTAEVEESSLYGGEPFHFRVSASGEEWTSDKEAWARRAITAAKNARSVLDDFSVGCMHKIVVEGDGEANGRAVYRITGERLRSGTVPGRNQVGRIRDVTLEIQSHAQDYRCPFPRTGTRPNPSTVAAQGSQTVLVSIEPTQTRIMYQSCGTVICGA
ncbi:MAG: hypothetical protein GXY67_07880 [Clostridiales bacterium]|nr:hypothetical protein [Clostridiales bacterium]